MVAGEFRKAIFSEQRTLYMILRGLVFTVAAVTAVLVVGESALAQSDESGSYLGQSPPGVTPQKFMPGLVSTDDHFEFVITVTADKNRLLFTRRTGTADVIMISGLTTKGWSDPEPYEPLNNVGAFEQHASPCQDRFYFSRLAPPPGTKMDGPPKTREEEAMLVGVWYIDSTETGWSAPVYCTHGMYVTTADDGTIYTTDIRGPVGISCTQLNEGKYTELQMLEGGINNPQPGAHPCISPDQTFLVFDSERESGYGKDDLYASFRDEQGNWSDGINLGSAINTPEVDFCPSLSPDGRYLFYSSNGDIYWVSTDLILSLQQDNCTGKKE